MSRCTDTCNDSLLIIAICIGFICMTIFGFVYIYQMKKRDEMIIRANQYAVNTQAIIDNSIPAILNEIIDECFTDYKLLVLFPKNEAYLTEEREREIRSDLAAKVTERLSPMTMDKLSLRYNVANIGAIIADKIYIVVMNYVIEHNAMLENK